jgi:hypothetical protein
MTEVEAAQLKEEGNRHFQLQDYKAAMKSYSQALKLTKDKALLATLYRNRAACGLKMVWGGTGRAGRQRGLSGWSQGYYGGSSCPALLLGTDHHLAWTSWVAAGVSYFLTHCSGETEIPLDQSRPNAGGVQLFHSILRTAL